MTIRTAARLGFSGSRVSGWSTLEYVATAETARVSSRAYGAADCARCCALMIRDAAMSSMARVIFFIDSVDLIRARYSRTDRAMGQPRFCLTICSCSTSSSFRASACGSWPTLIDPPSEVSNWSRKES